MTARACILGCAGLELGPEERAFLRDARPWGFILFRRNVDAPEQVRRLTEALRAAVDREDAPVLIDQEGGRVQRMGPPHWPAYPPGSAYGALSPNDPLARREAARLGARLMAHDLLSVGIDVDCVPVADVPTPDGHDVIGDRAYARTAEEVAVLARAAAEGLLAGGVLPVVKHIPGHGRARADSHHELPVVEASYEDLQATDFLPFRVLSDLPVAMTAHVTYAAVDRRRPATTSRKVVREVIREEIGFDGLLMTDDLGMKALDGSLEHLTRRSLHAGCDVVLHCSGKLEENPRVADASPKLAGGARRRAEAALARRVRTPEPLDVDEARARFAEIMGGASPRRAADEAAVDPTADGAAVTVHFQPRLDFEAVSRASADGDALVLELDGWEGPLDVLLELARRQKVDLRALSITALAEQYLLFVQAARRRRFALAADYLVMAAWLAFLKSRLLLPRAERPADDEAPAEEVAEALAFRLAKLAAMREAAEALQRLRGLGRDVFPRGDPDARVVHSTTRLEGDLHALVQAYVDRRRREKARHYAPERRVEAYPLEAARLRLRELLPEMADWAPLDALAPRPDADGEGPNRASCLASTLAAGLEMTRDGALQLRQAEAFAALDLRARAA